MKKQFLLLLLVLLISGMLFAQSAPNADYSALPGDESISSDVTASLFTNELDAAINLDTGWNSPFFTDLDANYVFAGVIGNIQDLDNNGIASSFTGAYHNGLGEMPWTVYTRFNFINADQATYTTETEDTGGDTNDLADKKYFNEIDSDLGFLIGISDISTGLYLNLNFDDNRVVGAATNGVQETATLTTTNVDKNDSTTSIAASVPFAMDFGGFGHYAVLSYDYLRTDDTTSVSYTGTNAGASGGNWDLETVDVEHDNHLGLFYKIKMPVDKHLLTPYVDFGLNFKAADYEITTNQTGVDDTSVDFEYSTGVDIKVGADFLMDLKASDWVNFRVRPNAFYSFGSTPYVKQATTKAGSTTTKTYTTEAIDYTHVNKVLVGLDAGVELKPENWFIGLMAGSTFDFSYTNTMTKDNTAYVDEATDPDDANDDDDSYVTTEAVDWASAVTYKVGFFLPLPEDYRLDVSLNGTNVTNWENVTVQLIVPID